MTLLRKLYARFEPFWREVVGLDADVLDQEETGTMRGAVFTVRAPLIAAGFACLLWALPAENSEAQGIDPAQACSGDAMRLCGKFIPDHAKIAGCLARNRRSLSPDCLQVF